jgi:membrane protease YdiL (CAAX protease family)
MKKAMTTPSKDQAQVGRVLERPSGAQIQTREPLRDLVVFFILAFGLSWLLWLLPLLKANGWAQLPEIVGLPGMFAPFGPSIAALWLTGRQSGREGIRTLLRRGWSLDFDVRWLWPTVLLMPVVGGVTVAVMALTGQSIQWEFGAPWQAWVPIFFQVLLLNALAEEFGWRGYALGRMLRRGSALKASLVLGALWGLWHLPLHLIEGTIQSAIPVYQFVLQQMVLAVFYTWLYNHTRGAVSVAILFHAVGNVVGAAVPSWTTDRGRWIGFGVQVVFAIGMLVFWGPRHLSRSPEGRYEPAPAQASAQTG